MFELAQAVPAPEVSTSLQKLLEYGLLGILLTLSLVGLWWKDRALNDAWKSRLTDIQTLQGAMVAQTAALTALTKSLDEHDKALDLISETQQKLTAMIEVLLKK